MKSLDKEKILAHGIKLINEKISTLQLQLAEYGEAIENETKSSAGDKYETSRAMIHQEQEKIHQQLNSQLGMRSTLNNINLSKKDKVELGSLIITDKAVFFISVPLGKVILNDFSVFFISPTAPLAKELIDKKAKDLVTFNGQEFILNEIH